MEDFVLLAQINFAEVPHLPYFPTKGICQFYVRNCFYSGEDSDCRVLFFDDLITNEQELVTDFSFLPMINDEFPAFQKRIPCQLSFSIGEEAMSSFDPRAIYIFGEQDFTVDKDAIIQEEYEDKCTFGLGHKLGGYPKDMNGSLEGIDTSEWINLLQIDCDQTCGMQWGDLGMGQFLIHKSDLEKRDFSRVIHRWGCF